MTVEMHRHMTAALRTIHRLGLVSTTAEHRSMEQRKLVEHTSLEQRKLVER